MKKLLIIPLLFLLAVACRRGSAPAKSPAEAFPAVSVPAMVTDPLERMQYAAEHFWDAFFEMSGPTDTSTVLGVGKAEVEEAFSSYASLMLQVPLKCAEKSAARMFDKLETRQSADTSNHCYPVITGMIAKYFYDPNSPLRDEDVYLPFVRRMAASEFTHPDSRGAYSFEARMCALNPRGSVAPDFVFRDAGGRSHRLSEVKADFILLFFSNPGCKACKDIQGELTAPPYMEGAVKEGKIAVVNIYIDSELDKWREYVPNYPSYWVTGYDPSGIIRNDTLYEVRAIPSLYLLDSERKIVFRDCPTERALGYIENN